MFFHWFMVSVWMICALALTFVISSLNTKFPECTFALLVANFLRLAFLGYAATWTFIALFAR